MKNKKLIPKKPDQESLKFLRTDTAGSPGILRIYFKDFEVLEHNLTEFPLAAFVDEEKAKLGNIREIR